MSFSRNIYGPIKNSSAPHEVLAPIHNSIAPISILLEHDVQIALGIDNIHDLFMPLVDGDMWFECRLLP
jgi:cytosine/creatinine deaminase